jgi:hypothetical protein
MPLPAKDRKLTYAEYLSWPAGERWELIDGKAWSMRPAVKDQRLNRPSLPPKAVVRGWRLVGTSMDHPDPQLPVATGSFPAAGVPIARTAGIPCGLLVAPRTSPYILRLGKTYQPGERPANARRG